MDERELDAVCDPSVQAADQNMDTEDDGINGFYQHSLDSKGRVIIPAKMRGLLGPKFVIGPTYDFSAIALYPKDKWIETRNSIRSMAKFNSSLKKYMEFFNGMSYRDQEYDVQGRVVLPTLLRERLLKDDTKELDLMGCETYIRINTHKADEESFFDFMGHMNDTMNVMNELGKTQIE